MMPLSKNILFGCRILSAILRCYRKNRCDHFILSTWGKKVTISISRLYISYVIWYILVTFCAFGLHKLSFGKNTLALPFFCSNYNLAVKRFDALYRVSHRNLTKFEAQ